MSDRRALCDLLGVDRSCADGSLTSKPNQTREWCYSGIVIFVVGDDPYAFGLHWDGSYVRLEDYAETQRFYRGD